MNRILETSLWGVGVIGAVLFCAFFSIGMALSHRFSWIVVWMVLFVAVAGAKGAVLMREAYRRNGR